jgi:branched-subunit amino acid transport protein
MYLNIVLPSRRKLKLNQPMVASKSIENIPVTMLVALIGVGEGKANARHMVEMKEVNEQK